MAVYDFFSSRNNGSNAASYIGHDGRLFYNSETGEIRLADGVTPGGNAIPITIATTSIAGSIMPGAGLSVTSGGVLNLNYGTSFEVAGDNILNLATASNTVLGGIKAGPGVTITSEGQIIIDSGNLSFSFGDFSGTVGTYANTNPKPGVDYALLSSVNADEDVVVASNGNGNVIMVGGFQIHGVDSGNISTALDVEPVFRIKSSGQVRVLAPNASGTAGAFELVGNDTGVFHPPNQTGVIFHSTGNTDTVNRVYHDSINNYSIIVGRRYNGNIGNLSPVLQGETIFRIAGQASTGSDFETFGPAKINWVATEDQGPNNQGGKISIDVTANGTAAFGNAVTVSEFTSDALRTIDIIPFTTDTHNLGSSTIRWGNIYLGQSSLQLRDLTTNENVVVSVNQGTFRLNGVDSLRLANLVIDDTTLGTINPSYNIFLGNVGDTGNVTLRRNLKFADNTIQSTAWSGSVSGNELTGSTLAENILVSSLTQVGTLADLTVTGNIVGGNISTGDTASVTGNLTAGNVSTTTAVITTVNATTINGTTANVTGNLTAGNISTTKVTATTGNITTVNATTINGTTANVTGNLTAGNVSGTYGTFTSLTGKYVRNYRDAGVIADGGTVTINFATDAVVFCQWDNNFTVNYSNFSVGSIVKLIAQKRAGTGTDTFSLDGLTAGHVSSGSTTVSGTAGIANFVEFTCTGATIADVYAKL